MFAGMTIYNLLWFFFLYSVLGWIVEVIYHVVACGKIVNRGFLNGPVCPIYGFGMIGVLWMVFLITPEGQDHPGLVSWAVCCSPPPLSSSAGGLWTSCSTCSGGITATSPSTSTAISA